LKINKWKTSLPLVALLLTNNLMALKLSAKVTSKQNQTINELASYCSANPEEKIADGFIVHLKSDFNNEAEANYVGEKHHLAAEHIIKDNEKTLASTNYSKVHQAEAEHGLSDLYVMHSEVRYQDETESCVETLATLRELSLDAEIDFVEPNYIRRSMSPIVEMNSFIAPSNSSSWSLENLSASRAWQLSTGKGIKVAMIDSGIEFNHPDLFDNIYVDEDVVTDFNGDGKVSLADADANNDKYISFNNGSEIIRGSKNNMFGNFYKGSKNPYDGYGHGTHVAGIIAANNKSNPKYNGIAYDSQLIAMKIFNERGSFTSVADLLNGIHSTVIDGARVLNASIGGNFSSRTELETYQMAIDVGVTVVAAAGNSNSNNDSMPVYPAAYPGVISVAATDYNNNFASFTNYGQTVDLAAPGVSIISTMGNESALANAYPNNFVENINGDSGYWILHGTSMATPYVSGIVALILEDHPEYNSKDVLKVLSSTAKNINSDKSVRYGLVNAYDALAYANEKNPPEKNTDRVEEVVEEDTDVEISGLPMKDLVELLFYYRPAKRNLNLTNNDALDIDNDGQIDNDDMRDIRQWLDEASNDPETFETIRKIQRSLNAVDINKNGIVGFYEKRKLAKRFARNRYVIKIDVDRNGRSDDEDKDYIRYIFELIDINLSI
jgi:subtilisin family serine protease